MSKANEMFRKLGYILKEEEKYTYEKDETEYEREKIIEINEQTKDIFCYSYHYDGEPITLKELQAINEKVKELGW